MKSVEVTSERMCGHFKLTFKNMLQIRCLADNADLAKCYDNAKIGPVR